MTTPVAADKLRGEIYCITDRTLSGLSPTEQTRQMLLGGARVVQLRDKDATQGDLLREGMAMRALTRSTGALLIINDDVDIAMACDADGVHLGQDDLSPTEARHRTGNDFIIGISTHTSEQLHRALAEPVDYIAVGPVFGTTTKANPDAATGVQLVEEALRLAGARPVVAIGGIHAGNLSQIPSACSAAIIGAIVKSGDIANAVRELRAARGLKP